MTEGIKNLFIFIDYLHTQMQYFETKKPLIDKVDNLLAQRNSLKPRLNYKDKIVFDKLKPQIENELSTLEIEVINIIKSKIVELDIADISTPIININAQSDLYRFQLNFTEVDVDLIQIAKRKYIEFRKTNNHSFYMGFFFSDLDRCLYEFFDFFKECDEVEDIAEKTVKVNSWEQVAEYLSTGTVANLDTNTDTDLEESMQNKFSVPQIIKILDKLNIRGMMAEKGFTDFQTVQLLADMFGRSEKSIRNNLHNTTHVKTAENYITELKNLKAKR